MTATISTAEKMKMDFEHIENRIMSGLYVCNSDMKFYKSYLASIKNTKAGNAGKRKSIKTGK
jgi:hypothetical protein